MERILEPELLDSLPPRDPKAIHSRRDLRRINFWMGNAKHLAGAILELRTPPRSILELGCGDGTMMLQVAGQLRSCGIRVGELFLLDLEPVVSDKTLSDFKTSGCTVQVLKEDLRSHAASLPHVDLIIANLFLHHFSTEDLRFFFGIFAQSTDALISCDPRRWRPALFATRFLWLLGCNHVTRHDAKISVRAGFRDSELSALWPKNSGFALHEYPAGYAAHVFSAERQL